MRSITEALKKKGSVLIAFSGGVDSSVLAALAYRRWGTERSRSQPTPRLWRPGSLKSAKGVAKEIGVKHMVILYDELEEPEFARNPVDRCYYCKKGLIRDLKKIAEQRGINTIIEGTNFSDLKAHRPGHRAVTEEGIYNPYIEFLREKRRDSRDGTQAEALGRR